MRHAGRPARSRLSGLSLMAALLGLVLLGAAACGPQVHVKNEPLDEDPMTSGPHQLPTATDVQHEHPRPVASQGSGQRTGEVPRSHLLAALDAGPAAFLAQIELSPRLIDNDTFTGWRLVQFTSPTSSLRELDLQPDDVLTSVNGYALARPDELMAVWDALRTAREIVGVVDRADASFELRFTIVDDTAPVKVFLTTPAAIGPAAP